MSETNDQRIYDRCLIRVGELEAENAKLLELCWELFEAERIGTTSDYWHELCGRARELGIEVDE